MPTAKTESPATPLAVLMVEDDKRVVDAVRVHLAKARIQLQHAGTLTQAETLLQTSPPDVIVLDLNLPDGNGVEFAAVCRRRGLTIPIIMVTGRDGVGDRVNGLRHGADDYLCKPFAVEELMARIEAVLRRSRVSPPNLLRCADVEVDLVKRELRRGELRAALSGRELDLLAYLMAHAEVVLEKARILREVWGDESAGDDNLLQVYANYLRNKLEQGVYPRLLHTVRGVGYVFSQQEPVF